MTLLLSPGMRGSGTQIEYNNSLSVQIETPIILAVFN
jgi:hypothetical protein